MRETLGAAPIFLPKKGDLWKRFGGVGKKGEKEDEKEGAAEETECEILSFGLQVALVGVEVIVVGVGARVGVVRDDDESLADSRILVIESPMC